MLVPINRMVFCTVAVAIWLTGSDLVQAQGFRYYGRTYRYPTYNSRNYYVPNQQYNTVPQSYPDPRFSHVQQPYPLQQYNTQPYTTQPYTVRKPVFDNTYSNGATNTIVTQTPQGPVRSTSRIDPYTGEQISTTYWEDPRTGLVTTSQRVMNPRTGLDQASTRTVNPQTGTVQRSNVTEDYRQGTRSERVSGVDPWSGVPYQSSSTVTPYGETYSNRNP